MKQELLGDVRKVVRGEIEQVRLEQDDTIELYNADMERRNEEKENMQALKNDILQNVEKMFKGQTRQLKMFLREETDGGKTCM